MPPRRRGPICGHTNPCFLATPGSTGHRDASDQDHPVAIPNTPSTLGSPFDPGRIVLAQAGTGGGIPGSIPSPWTKIPGVVFPWNGTDHPLFQHGFATSTKLAVALKWILDNSLYTTNRLVKASFIEVCLVWFWEDKRFIAYTAQANQVTTYNAKIDSKKMVFVAHVHPTRKERRATTTHERTTAASGKDLKSLEKPFSHHQYSIIVHRDVRDNKTPCGFIYDFKAKGKQVLTSKGSKIFTDVAAKYMELEKRWMNPKPQPKPKDR